MKKNSILAMLIPLVLFNSCSGEEDLLEEETSTDVQSDYEVVEILGRVIDGKSRQAISGLSVVLRINGESVSAQTSNGSGELFKGGFVFSNMETSANYYLEITDSSGVYAQKIIEDITPTALTNNAGDLISTTQIVEDLGVIELYEAKEATVSLIDLTSDMPITTANIYYSGAENNSSLDDSLVDVVPTLNEDNQYVFMLPDDGSSVTIKLKDLIGNSFGYVPYGFSPTNEIEIAEISADDNLTLYFRSVTSNEYTISLYVVDSLTGEDKSLPFSTLPITNTVTNQIHYASQSETELNTFSFVVTSEDSNSGTWNFSLGSLDINFDGINDTTTTHFSTSVLNMNNGAFDNRSLTQVIEIGDIIKIQDIQAEIISDFNEIIAGTDSNIRVAFDRPITLVSDVEITKLVLETTQPYVDVKDTADVFNTDDYDSDEGSVILNDNNTQYDYTHSDGVTSMQTLAFANSDGQAISGFEDIYSAEMTQVTNDIVGSLTAGDTILDIEIPAALTEGSENEIYKLTLVVQSTLSDSPILVFETQFRPKGTGSFSSLTQISIDDGDFFDNSEKTAATSSTVKINPDHTSLYLNLADSNFACAEDCTIEYLTIGTGSSGSPNVNTIVNNISSDKFIVSAYPLKGWVWIRGFSYETLNAGAVETLDVYLNEVYTIADTSTATITSSDNSVQAPNGNITGSAYYLLDVPENHYVEDQGLTDAYGLTAISGFDIEQEGVYYIYELPDVFGNLLGNDFIETIDLEFHLESDGTVISGTQSFPLK